MGFSSFDLIITLWNTDWYWEAYLYTHFKLILSIEKCNDWHMNRTVRSHALNAIYMCLGLFSPYHVRQKNYRFITLLTIQNRISRFVTVFLTLHQSELVFGHTFTYTESSWTFKSSISHMIENQNDFLTTYPIFMSYTVPV